MIRAELGLAQDAKLAAFVGRITRDKGLLKLAGAIRMIHAEVPNLHVVLVGFEEGNFERDVRAVAGTANDRLHFVGYSTAPERYLAASDFLELPSYREGFGSSVIEAAACGVPAIGTRIVGLVDSIDDGKTGILVATHDRRELTEAMRELAINPSLRRSLGQAAQDRAMRNFSAKALTQALRDHYAHALRTISGVRADPTQPRKDDGATVR
jgi:glycosyltransferase involved in cell wall biosynthesis